MLIPCVTSEGILTEDEAISYYYSTGEYLGYFDTVEESNRYALELHTQQEILYSRLEIGGQTVTLLDLKITIIPNQSALVEKLNLQEQSSGQQMVETRALLNEAMEAYQNAAESYANNVQQVDQLNQQKEIKLQDIKTIQENEKAQIEILNASLYSYLPVIAAGMVNVQTTDWRSELYLQGVQAEPLGIKSNYYYTELEYEWPKHYDLKKNSYTNGEGEIVYTGGFRDEYERDPSTMDYYLDFIDSDSAIGYLSVNNIGRRTHVVNSKDVNCLFECHIPDLILIESGAEDTQARINECRARGQEYILVDTAIYHMLSMGGSQRSAFVEIKDLLYEMTAYNESVSINTLPIYHLEPNIRIGINNPEINISGDYMINSISLPLDTNGTSSISAVRPITKM